MMTILGIDDALTIRKLFVTYLGNDYHVAVAKDDVEGLRMAQELKPDLILLDFILSDNVRGDTVCKALLDNPDTADIPVVLISSNADDIQKTKADYKNVIKTLLKPFKAPLLTATVATTIKLASGTKEKKTDGDTIIEKVEFSGKMAFNQPNEVLEVINEHRMTGVLDLNREYLFYFRDGNPMYLSTKNVNAYLQGFPYPIDHDIGKDMLEKAKVIQTETGVPLFFALEEMDCLTAEGASFCAEEQSQRLFSQAWTNPNWTFQFTRSTPPKGDSTRKSIHQWHLEALRHLGTESLGLMAWGDYSGIPCFTRKGCERFLGLDLTDEEHKVAYAINNRQNLQQHINYLSPQHAEALLVVMYRFLALDLVDLWPSTLATKR